MLTVKCKAVLASLPGRGRMCRAPGNGAGKGKAILICLSLMAGLF